ncbi:adaptin ear-binding coat-associated protein 1 [Aphelenchoides avenae]|nr:adaptin ear-binding coat-associated protein 1 [Aphelenchus avenae]
MEVYERVLLVKAEVFVYRIPPLTGAQRGHKAADWVLENPNWTGRLRLVTLDDKLEIRLEDKNSGQLYAKAPIAEQSGVDFESVSDSSRYFVIRLRNDNGQTAFVGVGFRDRSDSFDLNVAIQDHFKSLKKSEELTQEISNAPKLDLGFKEGQTITVNIGKKSTSTISSTPRAAPSSASGPVPLLPPPPGGSGSNRARKSQP